MAKCKVLSQESIELNISLNEFKYNNTIGQYTVLEAESSDYYTYHSDSSGNKSPICNFLIIPVERI